METKSPQGQKVQDPPQQGGEKERPGGSSNQGAGKRKPQDKDNKEKNKRRRPEKGVGLKGIRFRLLCYEPQAGAVIGKGGDTVRSVRKNTGAEVAVLPPQQGHRLRVVAIDSPAGNRAAPSYPAKEALLACATLTIEGDQPLHAPDPSQLVEVRLLVQTDLTAGLLGLKHMPGSLTAGDISAQCGANVIMPPGPDRPKLAENDEEFLMLRGPWPAVYSALAMVADEVRRQFFELRDPHGDLSLGPPSGPFGFGGPPPMGLVPGPFDPLEAMQLGIGLGMEMAVAAGVAAAGPHIGGPLHPNGPMPHGGDLSIAGLVPEFRSSAEAATPVTVTYKLVVPENRAGRFIGKGGENLREMRQTLGLGTLKVHPAVKDTAVRVLEVSSTEPAASGRCAAADALLYYVERLVQQTPPGTGGGGRSRFTIKMLLHHQHCGPIVGPRAVIIREISVVTNTSCVVHKKADMPPYGSADEQELEAEGEPPNLFEAIRMVAAIVRGCELRRHGIMVRETMKTPDFELVRGGGGAGGGPPPQAPHGPLGPMVPAQRGGMEPGDSWGPPDVGIHGVPEAGPSRQPLPQPQQRQPQPQQVPQEHFHQQQHQPQPDERLMRGPGQLQPQPQSQLPPHLQQQQKQQKQAIPLDAGPTSDKSSAASGSGFTGLPPLGPNDARLTIFVAATLVNAAEGINGTNVQQVQAVTNTVITLRQPVASGDYELDITGTFSQVMQAHTLLSNIMTIGAILQQKPQLAPQQAPPPATAAAGAPGQSVASTTAMPAAVPAAGGVQHEVVVQPNQGVVVTSQPLQQQQAVGQSPPDSQQALVQQQQQQPQQQYAAPQAQQPAAQGQVSVAPMQSVTAYSGSLQRLPQQQQQQQTDKPPQVSPPQQQPVPSQQPQQAPPQQQQQQPPQQQQQQAAPPQQQTPVQQQQVVPHQQQQQQQAPQPRPMIPAGPTAQQQQSQPPRQQQYPYNAEPTAPVQQDAATHRQAQMQQQSFPTQQPSHVQQQPVTQPAANPGATPATYQQQQQASHGQTTPYPYAGASPATSQSSRPEQPQQQYAAAAQSHAQAPPQPPYGQAYAAYPQSQQNQQHPYYQQQVQAAQPANHYAAYGSQGYGNTAGAAAPQGAGSVQAGVQSTAATAYGSQYGQGAPAATSPPAASGALTAPATSAAVAASGYGQPPTQLQQQYPSYGAAGYQSAQQPYYQAAQQQQQAQQPQAAATQAAHEQYYMQMHQQYAAYHAAAAAANTAGATYPPAAYGYGYGTVPATAPQ